MEAIESAMSGRAIFYSNFPSSFPASARLTSYLELNGRRCLILSSSGDLYLLDSLPGEVLGRQGRSVCPRENFNAEFILDHLTELDPLVAVSISQWWASSFKTFRDYLFEASKLHLSHKLYPKDPKKLKSIESHFRSRFALLPHFTVSPEGSWTEWEE